MDTQLLNAFIVTAEKQSFSLAAEQLGLTQSAISKRIALLEQQLSAPLFDRAGRTIHLTEAGRLLLPKAREILELTAATQQILSEQKNSVSGTLRLATSHHIGLHRLPPVLKGYTEAYPDVRLQIQFIDSEKAIQAITQDEFDLAVITLPENTDEEAKTSLQYHPIWEDIMKLVVNKTHPLKNNASVSLKQLAQYPAILPDTSTRTTKLVQQCFDEQSLTVNITMTTNHLDAIKMMVNVGLGWSALPESLIDNSLYVLPTKKVRLVRHLGCVHHRHRTLNNAARAMLHYLQDS